MAAIQYLPRIGGERWYLVRTKQQKEALVEFQLREFVPRIFLPQMRTRRIRNGVDTSSLTPLFPCYVFAQFELELSLFRVLYTVGVAGLVCAGSTPSEVDDSIIDQIRARGQNGIIEMPQRTFNPGELVRLTEGPMEGFAGIFEHYRSGSKRVALLLNAVGANMKVVVPASSIVPAYAD